MSIVDELARVMGGARSGGSVLCYHGITLRELSASSVVHVPLNELIATMKFLQRTRKIVPLQDLVRRQAAGERTTGLAAVTFDDAYAGLLCGAAEFLLREQIPITLFVVTDAAIRGERFWWDRIDDAFPCVTRKRWHEFECAVCLPEAYRRGQPPGLGPVRPLRQWILSEHRGRWPAALEPALRRLETDAGVQTAQRSMTFEEIDQLAASPLVDVGVHTRSHPVLPLLADGEAEQEIADCYDALRARYPRAVPLLAVPFGLFDPRTLALARKAGMNASLILGNATLARAFPGGPVPRFVMTAGERAWRIELKTIGVLERFRLRRRGALQYPALPSPTT